MSRARTTAHFVSLKSLQAYVDALWGRITWAEYAQADAPDSTWTEKWPLPDDTALKGSGR